MTATARGKNNLCSAWWVAVGSGMRRVLLALLGRRLVKAASRRRRRPRCPVAGPDVPPPASVIRYPYRAVLSGWPLTQQDAPMVAGVGGSRVTRAPVIAR